MGRGEGEAEWGEGEGEGEGGEGALSVALSGNWVPFGAIVARWYPDHPGNARCGDGKAEHGKCAFEGKCCPQGSIGMSQKVQKRLCRFVSLCVGMSTVAHSHSTAVASSLYCSALCMSAIVEQRACRARLGHLRPRLKRCSAE